MFGFFKRNIGKERNVSAAGSAAPSQATLVPDPVAAPQVQISIDKVMDIVSKRWTSNASSSLFFAQCGGFDHQVIGFEENNIISYNEIMLFGDPDNFTENDKVKAVQYFAIEAPSDFKKYYKDFKVETIAEAMFHLAISKRDSDWEKLVSKIDEKFEFIGPIFSRLFNSSVDKYGEEDWGPSLDEINEFIDRFFSNDDFDFFYRLRPLAALLTYIEQKLEFEATKQSIALPLDGIEFEHWTANEISRQGWGVQVSQASGDQGVDVLARREGCSVAIQCKRYTQPIGNKAVQEVFAAKQFCSADHACVVGTGGFTRSARELAAATGVILIEAEAGLQSFSERFGFEVMEYFDGEPLADIDSEALRLARKYMDKDGNPYKQDVLIENRNQLGIFLQSRSTLDQYTYSNDDGETVQRYLAQTKHLADTALPFTVQLDAFTAMVHLNVGILVLTSSITDQQRQKTLNDPDEEPRILSMLESRDENEEVFVFEILSMSALNELVVFLETIARSFNIELEDEGYEQIKHHLNFAA